MNDELTGEPSSAREEAERMSEMVSDDAHDELMCSMDVVAEVHAQDAERELQRERASVGCVRPYGDGAGGDGSEAGRALEGGDGGARGCEGVEQGAPMTACEAGGSDEDEAMAGKENVPVQRADGGSGLTGGIKKKPQRRAKGAKNHWHRQEVAQLARRGSAMQGTPILPSGV